MIDNIVLKFGSSPSQPKLKFDVTPMTIFVGPNNSGKSKILREIEFHCRKPSPQGNRLILEDLSFIPLTEEEIEYEIEQIKDGPYPGESVNEGYTVVSKVDPQNNQGSRVTLYHHRVVQEAQNPNSSRTYFSSFLNLFTMRMDGTNRLNLLTQSQAGDLQKSPKNHLAHLFQNNRLREEVRRIVHDAFGKYYVIDPTNIGNLRVRLSDVPPSSEEQEKGWREESVRFHKNAIEITNTSDGVKAFAGIITNILAGDPKIILIDEPEAFLHPSLSNKLGNEVGKSLRGSNKRLFVATHSSNFLMGCIQSGSPINIVRLTYKNSTATSRVLPKEKILRLMRNPLLRSTGVLSGLFYESVVVTEGDSDRAFYNEINERLLAENDSRGISNCLFINAQNKQTVWDIVGPLRELGIPAIGIVDIDVLKEGGQVFTKLLSGAFLPEPSHTSLHTQRQALKRAFDNTGKDMKRDGGINLLDGDYKEACYNFFGQLEEYGIFIIENGELESWLPEYEVGGHGSKWLIEMFNKMGDDPEVDKYLKPQVGDVWEFMGKIKSWIDSTNPKGIPD